MNKKLLLKILGVLIFSFAFTSCQRDETRTPQPERNPVVFSSETQSTDFRVKYMISIEAPEEYMENNKNYIGNVISQTLRYGDWLEVFYTMQQGNKENQIITISVKENKSAESRSFTFNLNYYMKSFPLTVKQEGKV